MQTAAAPARKIEVPAHPRFKGFEAFAAREIFPRLAEKDAERRRVLRRVLLIVAATAVIIALLLVLAFAVLEMGTFMGLLAFGLAPAIIGGLTAIATAASFQSRFNEFLLTKTCEHLKLRYTGSKPTLPFSRFMEARLLPKHDECKFEDGADGVAPGVVFSAAEAMLIEKGKTDQGGDDDKEAWRGLLMEVPAPRPFAGRTIVLPERGAIDRFFDDRAAERIELGVGEIEKGLEIRTTDPAEARAVLTERVMRRLGELASRLGREKPALGLIESSILFAVETGRDRFPAPSIFDPIDEADYLDRVLADFAHLLELAEALHEALGARGGRSSPLSS
jgi:hypothetical protein